MECRSVSPKSHAIQQAECSTERRIIGHTSLLLQLFTLQREAVLLTLVTLLLALDLALFMR